MYLPFLSVVLLVEVISACDFPDFMQTNGTRRDWWTHIQTQYTQFTTQVRVVGGELDVVTSEPSFESYTRICLTEVSPGKYLTSHNESGQEGSRYTCIQFLKRNNNVVQLRTAATSRRRDATLCDDRNMELDPWLVIDKAHISDEHEICSLRGGYTTRVIDMMNPTSLCDGFNGETRLESECHRGEGITFFFRSGICTPDTLYMYPTQPTVCRANWREGRYNYMLLQHNYHKYMWVMRYLAGPTDSFTAYLLLDLVADDTRLATLTDDYIRIDAVKDHALSATNLCVDDYERCATWRTPCEALHLTCPRRCGVCNTSRPSLCEFPTSWRGSWHEDGQSATPTAIITDNVLSVFDDIQEDFRCVDWDRTTQHDRFTRDQMLVHEFDNGCRPRYSCVQVRQSKPASILHLKLSQAQLWPFTSSVEEAMDCTHFSYDNDEKYKDNRLRSRYQHLLYDPSKTDKAVNCGLNREMRNYAMQLNNGSVCTGSVSEAPDQKRLSISFRDCNSTVDRSTVIHTCLQSTRLPSRDTVITSKLNDSLSERIYCWLFPRRPRHTFYLIAGEHCSESVLLRIEEGEIVPVITFTKKKRPLSSVTPREGVSAADETLLGNGTEQALEPNHNKTVVAGETGDSTSTAPYVVMAAVVLFAIFQIPCICRASSS